MDLLEQWKDKFVALDKKLNPQKYPAVKNKPENKQKTKRQGHSSSSSSSSYGDDSSDETLQFE
jgi:hypothetical protein